MRLTLIEKLASQHAGATIRSGDIALIRPRHVMTHDNTGAVIPKFKEMCKLAGSSLRVFDPRQPVFAIDHDIQNHTPENLGKYAKIEAFAREHSIDFYPAGTGISHQVMIEQGYITPGSMVVGSDSHSTMYGALCCLGTPVVRTDAASIWATGTTWWQVPPIARVHLHGSLRAGVVGKDVIIALCGAFRNDEVLNHAVEFVGEGVAGLTIDQRMSISNMCTEWGALAGVFPFDDVLLKYLLQRAGYFDKAIRPGIRREATRGTYTRDDAHRWCNSRESLSPDEDAQYAIDLDLDLSSVLPHVAGPNDVKAITPVPDIEQRQIKINKAWLMSCVNARLEDILCAAQIMQGKRVAQGVEFYLAAASSDIQREAERTGAWQVLLNAGAIELPPGCGTCIGLGKGTIKKGEVGISATNRNFEGRMGDKEGLVYLASPAVVAASAIAGYICEPQTRQASSILKCAAKTSKHSTVPASNTKILPGFPSEVDGRAWFLDRDNLNTDGIYAGKHTYNDSMTPEQMADVVFENYDPEFRLRAAKGDIVIGGYNFGTGSSREQAATALKHFGVPCVVAASFSETYKRNAFNNGLVVFECPALVDHIRSNADDNPTKLRVAGVLHVDYYKGVLALTAAGATHTFPFKPLSTVAQALIVHGGAEAAVAQRLKSSLHGV